MGLVLLSITIENKILSHNNLMILLKVSYFFENNICDYLNIKCSCVRIYVYRA